MLTHGNLLRKELPLLVKAAPGVPMFLCFGLSMIFAKWTSPGDLFPPIEKRNINTPEFPISHGNRTDRAPEMSGKLLWRQRIYVDKQRGQETPCDIQDFMKVRKFTDVCILMCY